MNNVRTVILLVIACIVVSYFLSQIYIPLAYVGLLVSLGIIIYYVVNKNKRTR